jgi:uncharacterized protein (DUF1501 family)
MSMNRRMFLKRTSYYGLGAATFAQVVKTFSVTNALAQTGSNYRALVCVFFNGGADGNNLMIPVHDSVAPYGSYANYFNERNAQNLAFTQAQLAPTQVSVPRFGAGFDWAFHPSMTNMANLYRSGKLAVIANAGPLVVPLGSASTTPRADYNNAAKKKPFQLYSHSDQIQQWQTCISTNPSATGWGGRIADRVNPGSIALPQITSLGGNAAFTLGQFTAPLSIGTGALNQVLVLSGFGTSADETARRNAMNFLRTIDRQNHLVSATSEIMQTAVNVSAQLSGPDPTLTTTFPNTTLGNQLRQVAKVIKANLTQISPMLNRQIFFCQLGGWDTHQNQMLSQGGFNSSGAPVSGLAGQVDGALNAFYNAMQELNGVSAGISQRVVLFTLSDFNRTWNPAGSGTDVVGTDHAWGSYQFVLSDGVAGVSGVQGGNFYGVAVPANAAGNNGTIIPTLLKSGQSGGVYDASTRGLWIPTCATAQYARHLALWYGLSAADVDVVFPGLNMNFGTTTPASLNFLL